jgi:hypothetical protein
MNHEIINQKLVVEYETYFPELLLLFNDEIKPKLSLPLLMHVYPEYDKLDKRLMVVGQETKRWFSTLSDNSENVQNVLKHYRNFELAKNYYSSPFWRFNKTLFKKLNPNNNPHGLLWTNLSKIDQNGKGVNDFVRKTNKAGYKLLVKEIEITKPDTVVFLTSWKEDTTLKSLFNGLNFKKVEDLPYNYLIRLESKLLPFNSFRTYHPRFLNSKRSKYSINDLIGKILSNCE